MTHIVEIFVGLIGEGVDAWRPAQAEKITGNVYKIVAQPYNREIETWAFEPGESVVCEFIETSEGRILAATSRSMGPE